ncbi:MAG: VOC family protein, partial [Chloroflexota bacterium]
MAYVVNHVHLKSNDPKATADWFVDAFGLRIESDNVRVFGDRFLRCFDGNNFNINISGPRTDEKLGPGDANAHLGLEHFGFDSEDLDADIRKLTGMGAELK